MRRLLYRLNAPLWAAACFATALGCGSGRSSSKSGDTEPEASVDAGLLAPTPDAGGSDAPGSDAPDARSAAPGEEPTAPGGPASAITEIIAQITEALSGLVPTLDAMGNLVNPPACPEEQPTGMCPALVPIACLYDDTGCLCAQGEWNCLSGLDPSAAVNALIPLLIAANQPAPDDDTSATAVSSLPESVQEQIEAAIGAELPAVDQEGNTVNPDGCPESEPSGMCASDALLVCSYGNAGCVCGQGEWNCADASNATDLVSLIGSLALGGQ